LDRQFFKKDPVMNDKRLDQIEKRIEKIKEAISKIGPMRLGSLTRQYKDPKEKSGLYWLLSYTRTMRSGSDYVRADCVAEVRKEIVAYKRFKALMEEWIDLGIESFKLRLKFDKKTRSG
jgi:hypothetical protein